MYYNLTSTAVEACAALPGNTEEGGIVFWGVSVKKILSSALNDRKYFLKSEEKEVIYKKRE